MSIWKKFTDTAGAFVKNVGDEVLGQAIWEKGFKKWITDNPKEAFQAGGEVLKAGAPMMYRQHEIRTKQGMAEGQVSAAVSKLDPSGMPKILEQRINSFLHYLKGKSSDLRRIFIHEVGINTPEETDRIEFLKTLAEIEPDYDPAGAILKEANVKREEMADGRGFLTIEPGVVDKAWDGTKKALRAIPWSAVQQTLKDGVDKAVDLAKSAAKEYPVVRDRINASPTATETVNRSADALKRAKDRLNRL